MIPKKQADFEYLDVDDDTLVVFDPDSGDTYYINAAGISVMGLVDGVSTIDDIAAVLADNFDTASETIKVDISELLNDLSEKKVVVLE
jgi:hypothetical protein